MKYIAVLDTDDYEDFEFYEDGNGKYIHGIDAGSVNGEWIALYFTECEQKSILDKIIAEIEQNAYPIVHGVNNHEKGMTLYGILQIIDKYKAENENKEIHPVIDGNFFKGI